MKDVDVLGGFLCHLVGVSTSQESTVTTRPPHHHLLFGAVGPTLFSDHQIYPLLPSLLFRKTR